jgi:hypothetical protein
MIISTFCARIALDTLKLRSQNYYRAQAEGVGTAPADRSSAPSDFLQSGFAGPQSEISESSWTIVVVQKNVDLGSSISV